MIIRISKGHTGRKVVFRGLDRAVLYIMLAALVDPRRAPASSPPAPTWAGSTCRATCWLLAFGILAWRYIPMLMQPRIDGREH
jgi:uncharacterized protein involved in response to NO